MRAARFHARQDVRIDDVPEPAPGPGQVLLRPGYAGICGSDLHLVHAPEAVGVDPTRPHPLTGAQPPQVMGHEFAGTVEQVGEGVTTVRPGDRAAVFPIFSCGRCAACTTGRVNACRTVGFLGLTAEGGGMSEHVVVAAERLHLLPDGVDLRLGALVEPMAVAWRAVTASRVRPGGSALVAGAGPIGIGLWFALRARGVERVVVSEPSAVRRAAVAALGAHVVDPAAEDLAKTVDPLTDGAGVDAAFDAAGAAPAFLATLASLTPGGRAVVVAAHEQAVELNPTMLVLGETEVVGSLAYLPADFDAVIAAMAEGAYDTTGWVEERPLADLLAALADLGEARASKILLTI
ncbi:alcohol dehydrogenase catalytic domain-containing protein [Pseudonocardia sp. NPDC049154]|uniref:alcohol dehydrogenase catalytic domain-containing protein n=1 Tax=Pseudonocardia sp. NPDC049154 TaxID=3155501 RepID=UPI0033FBCE87